MVRSIVAVIAGYMLFAVPSGALFAFTGHDPHLEPTLLFAAGTIVYGMVFAFLGGWTAGVIAKKEPVRHAVWVAAIMLLLATFSVIVQYGHGSMWSQLSAIVLMAPCAAAAGVLRKNRMKEGETSV